MDSSPAPPASQAPAPASASKLRLMCSYGGHIVPRPMDKTLCYAGGETRIVAVDRRTTFSLSSLTTHLSKSLLNGCPFSLKYQLPNHDLDSLISISSDEDLCNMIEEYDRLAASPSRLRFFLFPSRSAGSGDGHGDLCEDWFVDALKNVGVVAKERSSDSESEGKVAVSGGLLVDSGTSLPESIVFEKNSSFGSTSSSASTSNSPAIRSGGGGSGGGEEGCRLRVQDFKAALSLVDSISSDCSLASQIFSPQGVVYQDASGFNESKAVPANLLETESNVADHSLRGDLLKPVQVSGYMLAKPMDQQHHQVPAAPLLATPQPPPQQYIHPTSQPQFVTHYYPSSVPVASYPAMYQPYVQTHQPVQYQINTPYGYPVYMMPVGQAHNPHEMSFATPQGIAQGHPQAPSNPVMVASPMYYDGYNSATPASEYATKVYTMPAAATQTVTMPSDDHPSQPKVPPNSAMVSSPVVYEGHKPAPPATEYTTKVYRTSAVATQPANLPSDDHHHHQVGAFPPANQPSKPVTSAPLDSLSYMSEYDDSMHAQIYKTQPPAPTLSSQLKTATNATKVMLSETFAQLHVDNTKH